MSLEEGLKAVVPLYSIDEIQDKNHDKLVHLSGKLQTDMVRKIDQSHNSSAWVMMIIS